MKKTLFITTFIAATIGIFALLSPFTSAHELENSYLEEIIKPGDQREGIVTFTNDDDRDIIFNISAENYQPTGAPSTLKKDVFITPTNRSIQIKSGETVDIAYKVHVPKNTAEGTYINILSIIDKNKPAAKEDVGILGGLGAVFVIHVSNDEGQSVLGEHFAQNSSITLEEIDKGFPYILDTKIKYTYTNNSTFIFTPKAEVRFINEKPELGFETVRTNLEDQFVFPGEEYEETIEVDMWTLRNMFNDISVISHSYVDEDASIKIENSLIISIRDIVIRILIGLFFITVGIIFIVIFIYKQRSIKKKKGKR